MASMMRRGIDELPRSPSPAGGVTAFLSPVPPRTARRRHSSEDGFGFVLVFGFGFVVVAGCCSFGGGVPRPIRSRLAFAEPGAGCGARSTRLGAPPVRL